MSYNLKGIIEKIKETQTITDSFRKREFVVKVEDATYVQVIALEFVQDKCDILNDYKIGDSVEVDFNLNGREWIPKDGGEARYFNTLQCWKISKMGFSVGPPQIEESPQSGQEETDDLPF